MACGDITSNLGSYLSGDFKLSALAASHCCARSQISTMLLARGPKTIGQASAHTTEAIVPSLAHPVSRAAIQFAILALHIYSTIVRGLRSLTLAPRHEGAN